MRTKSGNPIPRKMAQPQTIALSATVFDAANPDLKRPA
jgi:hypothetical protein